jgi:ribosome-associated heat shock protein Hsp15
MPGGRAATGPPVEDGAEDRAWQRLDKWLWCARFMAARADCARLVAEGLLRINRQPTDKPHATLPLRGRVRVLEVLALAPRRGPASEARLLYRDLEERNNGGGPADPCGSAERAAYRPPYPIPTRSPR